LLGAESFALMILECSVEIKFTTLPDIFPNQVAICMVPNSASRVEIISAESFSPYIYALSQNFAHTCTQSTSERKSMQKQKITLQFFCSETTNLPHLER